MLWGPADLNDHRRGNQRNYAKFQTDLVFSPRPALVSVGSHKYWLPGRTAHAGRLVRLHGNERRHQAGRPAIVRLHPDHRSRNRRNLIHSVWPMLRQ